jgi:hypothetical protein
MLGERIMLNFKMRPPWRRTERRGCGGWWLTARWHARPVDTRRVTREGRRPLTLILQRLAHLPVEDVDHAN